MIGPRQLAKVWTPFHLACGKFGKFIFGLAFMCHSHRDLETPRRLSPDMENLKKLPSKHTQNHPLHKKSRLYDSYL